MIKCIVFGKVIKITDNFRGQLKVSLYSESVKKEVLLTVNKYDIYEANIRMNSIVGIEAIIFFHKLDNENILLYQSRVY